MWPANHRLALNRLNYRPSLLENMEIHCGGRCFHLSIAKVTFAILLLSLLALSTDAS